MSIPIDIKSQSIGNIGIDIKAQTLANLNINIAASAITLNVNLSSQSAFNLNIDIAEQSVGNISVNIAASAITLNINITSSSISLNIKTSVGEHVDTDVVSSVTINVDITAQTIGNIGIDIKAQTLANLNINIAASAITLSVNITSQTANINVNVVNASITITGAVTITSGAVTITTTGGTNIIVDKLTQGAYVETQRIMSNNGAGVSWRSIDAGWFEGKFFSRGCRGYLKSIFIYCKDTGTTGGIITVYITPYINGGIIYSGNITIPAGGVVADWRGVAFNVMWQYDSMFIYWTNNNAQLAWGYDDSEPYDAYYNYVATSWTQLNSRRWIQVYISGQTVGDLPVSGTVNNVQIPSSSSVRQYVQLEIPKSSELLDTIQYGSGKLLYALFYITGVGNIDLITPKLYCDGVSMMPFNWTFNEWAKVITATTPLIAEGEWGTGSPAAYVIVVAIPFEFKQSLQLGFYNYDAANALWGYVSYCYSKNS